MSVKTPTPTIMSYEYESAEIQSESDSDSDSDSDHSSRRSRRQLQPQLSTTTTATVPRSVDRPIPPSSFVSINANMSLHGLTINDHDDCDNDAKAIAPSPVCALQGRRINTVSSDSGRGTARHKRSLSDGKTTTNLKKFDDLLNLLHKLPKVHHRSHSTGTLDDYDIAAVSEQMENLRTPPARARRLSLPAITEYSQQSQDTNTNTNTSSNSGEHGTGPGAGFAG
jgi:hypothetical protein